MKLATLFIASLGQGYLWIWNKLVHFFQISKETAMLLCPDITIFWCKDNTTHFVTWMEVHHASSTRVQVMKISHHSTLATQPTPKFLESQQQPCLFLRHWSWKTLSTSCGCCGVRDLGLISLVNAAMAVWGVIGGVRLLDACTQTELG